MEVLEGVRFGGFRVLGFRVLGVLESVKGFQRR